MSETTTAPAGQPVKPAKTLQWVLLAVIVTAALVGGGVYWALTSGYQQEIDRLSDEITALSAATADEDSDLGDTTMTPTPDEALQENFSAAINSGNYAALEQNFADPVTVVIDATECCGELTPTAAVAQLDYLSDAGNFNFDPSQQVVQQLRVNQADTFADFSAIGIAANKMVVAYSEDTFGNITELFMAASYDLYDLP